MSFDSFYSNFDPKSEQPSGDPAVPKLKLRSQQPDAEPESTAEESPPAPVEAWKPPPVFPTGSHYDHEPVVVRKPAFEWTRRNVLLAVLAGTIVTYFVTLAVRPSGVSVRSIRNHPAEYDGQQVLVRGKVGEVFPMGASCAYNLHQGWGGKDTIVVFSRGRIPQSGKSLKVEGSVSMGYLDGQARPAIFETGQ